MKGLCYLVVVSATAWVLAIPLAALEQQGSPNIQRVGLGTERTVILVLGSECGPCWETLDFYRTLLGAPGMDGKQKRLVVLASDGVWPVKRVIDAKQFTPHRLTSYPRVENTIELPDQPPGILVVDGKGVRLGMWTGRLTPRQESEVLAAIETK
jgi:hypothetical protein